MTGYTKLFHSLLASTVWRTDDATRIVWITLLAMADRDGICEGSLPGLADFARVSLEQCEHAISVLSSPDPYSRSQEHEGRRLITVDGIGWQILNYAKYRGRLSAEERREYNRNKQAEHRARKRSTQKPACQEVSMTVIDEPRLLPKSAHTEAEADTEADKEKEKETDTEAETNPKPKQASPALSVVSEPPASTPSPPPSGNGLSVQAPTQAQTIAELFELWKAAHDKPMARLTADRKACIKARLTEGYSAEQLQQAILGCLNSTFHMGRNDRGTRFNDLTLICRSGSRVEAFIDLYNNPNAQNYAKTTNSKRTDQDVLDESAAFYRDWAERENAANTTTDIPG